MTFLFKIFLILPCIPRKKPWESDWILVRILFNSHRNSGQNIKADNLDYPMLNDLICVSDRGVCVSL